MLSVELIIVVVLIVINGLLSMSELAVVSSRPARLSMLAAKGVHGAERALTLAADPGKFLSTVQIGITLVGVLSGAFSGATRGHRRHRRRRHRGHAHHLCDVDRRRTGAEAGGAAGPREHRGEGCAGDARACKDIA